jgi:hypothetical protein
VSPRIRRLGRRVVLQHEISLIYHRLRSGAGHAENGRFAGLLVDVSLDGVLQVLLAGRSASRPPSPAPSGCGRPRTRAPLASSSGCQSRSTPPRWPVRQSAGRGRSPCREASSGAFRERKSAARRARTRRGSTRRLSSPPRSSPACGRRPLRRNRLTMFAASWIIGGHVRRHAECLLEVGEQRGRDRDWFFAAARADVCRAVVYSLRQHSELLPLRIVGALQFHREVVQNAYGTDASLVRSVDRVSPSCLR